MSASNPVDLYVGIVQDPRFEEMPVEDRLAMLDQVADDNLPVDAPLEQMEQWTRARGQTRLVARTGLDRAAEIMQTLGSGEDVPQELKSEEAMRDLLEGAGKSLSSMRTFEGERGQAFTHPGLGQIQLTPGDDPVGIRLLPHPTKTVVEIDTPDGSRRTQFDSIDQLPKTGDEWGRFIVDKYPTEFKVDEPSRLGTLGKAAARGAVDFLANTPLAARGIIADNREFNSLMNKTIDPEGNLVDMDPETRDSLDAWADRDAANEIAAEGSANSIGARQQRTSELHNEHFLSRHLKGLSRQKIPVTGQTVDGKFIADDRFAPLELMKDGSRQNFLKEGQEVNAADLLKAIARSSKEEYLGEAYRDYLATTEASDEAYGRTNAEALRALRSGIAQKASNFVEEVAKVGGQATNVIPAAPLGPVGLGLAGYASAYAGHYAETNRAIYEDAVSTGSTPGEALLRAQEGAIKAADAAAPIDAAGDALLGGALKAFGPALRRLAPKGREAAARQLASAIEEMAGNPKKDWGDAVSSVAAQFASEAGGEFTRATIEDQHQVNKDGWGKNLKDALHEGVLAMFATGAISSAGETMNAAAELLEQRRVKNLYEEALKGDVTIEDLQRVRKGTQEEREAFVRRVREMDKARKATAPTDRYTDNETLLRTGSAELDRIGRQAPVKEEDNPFHVATPTTDQSSLEQFQAVGKTPGDIIEVDGTPVRLTDVSPNRGQMAFTGFSPDGQQVSLSPDQVQASTLVGMKEAMDTVTEESTDATDFAPAPPPIADPVIAPPAAEGDEEEVTVLKDPEGDWNVGTAKTLNAGPNEAPAGPLTFNSASGGVDLTKRSSSTFEMRAYRGQQPLETTEAAPAPLPEGQETSNGPSVVNFPKPARSINTSVRFWSQVFGPDPGISIMAPSSDGTPGAGLTLGKAHGGPVNSVATVARMFGSDALIVPGMEAVPVMLRPLSSMKKPSGQSVEFNHGTRATYAHAYLNDSGGVIAEAEALLLDSNTFAKQSLEYQKRFFEHEMRHMHVRRMLNAAGHQGASPELVQFARDFDSMGKDFINAYEKEPSLWAGTSQGLRDAVASGDPRLVADELVAYALTEPAVAEAMRRVGPDFQPLEPGKPVTGDGPKTLLERIMALFKRAFELAGFSKRQAGAQAEALNPNNALNRVQAFARDIASIAGGRFKSREAAEAKARKTGLRKYSIKEEDGKFTLSYRLDPDSPMDVFSGANLTLGSSAGEVAEAVVVHLNATPDTTIDVIMGSEHQTAAKLLDPRDKSAQFNAQVARDAVNLWTSGLKEFPAFAKGLKTLYPHVNPAGVWDAMNEAIVGTLSAGGVEGVLALKFKGDAAALRSYRNELRTGGRAEDQVNAIVASALTGYKNTPGPATVSPDTALLRFGPLAPPMRRFIAFERDAHGRGQITLTKRFHEKMEAAKKRGNVTQIQELSDIALSLDQYKQRQSAVRSAKRRLGQVAQDRMGMALIPHNVSAAIWEAYKRSGRGARADIIRRAYNRFNATPNEEAVQKLHGDLKWYAQQNVKINRGSPEYFLEGPKIQAAAKAAKSELFMEGKKAGKQLANGLFYYSTENGNNSLWDKQGSPLAMREVFDILSGRTAIPTPVTEGFSREEIEEAMGDSLAWNYRNGVLAGLRTNTLQAMLDASQIDGDVSSTILPLVLGLPVDRRNPNGIRLGGFQLDPGVDFFEGIVAPAVARAAKAAVGSPDPSGVIVTMRKQWQESVAKARDKAGYKDKGTISKSKSPEFIQKLKDQAFDDLVSFNREKWGNLFRFPDSWEGHGDTAVGLLFNLRRAFGTQWARPMDAGFLPDNAPQNHEWVSAQQRGEERELQTQMTRSIMFLADYDKGKAADLAVALASEDGGLDEANLSRRIEELLLERAAPSLMDQAYRANTKALIPSLANHLGASPKDVALMLSLGGASVVSINDLIAVSGDVNNPGQQIANEQLSRYGDESPVLLIDSSSIGDALSQRLNLDHLGETARNLSGIRFTTIPGFQDAPEGSWGAPFNVLDTGTLRDRSGALTALLGAQGVLAVEQSGSAYFRTHARAALRGMAELATALGDAYPMVKKLAEQDNAQAALYGRALEALDSLGRVHGPITNIPATVMAGEILSNPGFRQALLVIPDVFENNRRAVNKESNEAASRIVEADNRELMRQWTETNAVVDPDTGGLSGLLGDYDAPQVTGGKSRFRGMEGTNSEASLEFASTLQQSLDIDDVRDSSPWDSLNELGDQLEMEERAGFRSYIEGFLDNDLAQRQVAMALEIMRIGVKARARQGESAYAYAGPRQESRITSPEGYPVPMPATDVAEATGEAPVSRNDKVAELIDTTEPFLSASSSKRFADAVEKLMANFGATFEMTEAMPNVDSKAIESMYNFRQASGGNLLAGGTREITDEVTRKAEAKVMAQDFLTYALPPKVRQQFSDRPVSEQFLMDTAGKWIEDILEYVMRPGTSEAVTNFYRSKVHFAFGSDSTDITRPGDMRWHQLFDAWRRIKGEDLAYSFLSGARGKINALDYRERYQVLKHFASNDAIFRKLGAKSPEALDRIMEIVMLMEYGDGGKGGFTGFRSATIPLEKQFNAINKPLGPYAEAYVWPSLAGYLMNYGTQGTARESVAKMIQTLTQAARNLEKEGKHLSYRSWKERHLYREAMNELLPVASDFVNGLLNRNDYEAKLKSFLKPAQQKWLSDTVDWFNQVRPAMEMVSVITGNKQGMFENYLPLMNGRLDGASSVEDFNYRAPGESVGTSRPRLMNNRWLPDKEENYLLDLNGSRILGKARTALFSMKTFESSMLLHDLLGTVQDTGKRHLGILEEMADVNSRNWNHAAAALAMSPKEQGEIGNFVAALRMVFDRERTGFQSGLHIDNQVRRAMIRAQQAGAYFSLADVEQLYRQTLPAMSVYGLRMARDPRKLSAHARVLASFVDPSTRRRMVEVMKEVAPSIYQRGVDGQEEMQRKLSVELLRKSRGLDLGNRITNARRRVVAGGFNVMRALLDWTTGKPDGLLTRLLWFTEYTQRQNDKGLYGKDVWDQPDVRFGYDSQKEAEEIMGQSEMTRRGELMQAKGGSVGSEAMHTFLRAYGSYNVSMAAHADALWSEVRYGAPMEKLTAALKLAEIPMQQAIFRLLAKPFRDLWLVNIGAAIFGWDEKEKKRRYKLLLEKDPNARVTKPIESFEDAWTRYGWRFMTEQGLQLAGAPGGLGTFGYYSSLPVFQDLEVLAVENGGENLKAWVTGKKPEQTRDLSPGDIAEKALGYAGATFGRAADVYQTTGSGLASGKLSPEDTWKIATIALATRGVSARINQELEIEFKPKKKSPRSRR